MAATDLSSSPALPTQSATPESQPRSSTQQQQQQQQEEEDKEQQQQQDSEQEYLFSCRCDSAKAVASLLSCLTTHEKKNALQPVTVFCTPTALTFHVYGTTARQSQASVDIHKTLFCDYQVVQQGEFCVNLTSVLECLGILGQHHLERTKLCWAYCSASQTFEMELLEEGGVLSTAAIPGLVPPTAPSKSLALAFSQSPIVSRILLKSEWLKQAWSELEHVPGATTCTVAVTNKALQLATVGHAGECVVSLPASSGNQGSTLLSLECSNDDSSTNSTLARSYPWSSFRLGMRGLDIAEETCLTMNEAGMMAIQHQVLVDDGSSGSEDANFVDFLMACLENDDNEDEQQQEEEPNVPPPLSLGWKSQEEEQEESEEEEDALPPISAAPLFGTVVAEDNASVATGRSTRNVRRRRQQTIQVDSSQEEEADDDEPLDVTASVTPTRRRRRGRDRHEEEGASSPEIGYGDD